MEKEQVIDYQAALDEFRRNEHEPDNPVQSSGMPEKTPMIEGYVDYLAAVKAWDKIRPDDTTIDQMATALRRQKNSEQWQRGIGIPYASSWLNARRWEDDWQAPEEPEDFFEDEEDLPEWT